MLVMNYLYTHILYPCDLTTGTVQCDYSPDLLALYLPLYQYWSPLSSTLKKQKTNIHHDMEYIKTTFYSLILLYYYK